MLRVGLPNAPWRSIRIWSHEPLRFGAFSRDGSLAVLTTAAFNRGADGGPVEIIVLAQRKPGVEWVGRPWYGRLYKALAACPPAISADGRKIAVDLYRPLSMGRRHGQEIFVYSGKRRFLAGIAHLRGDVAQSLAFSPDGKFLAVECWYRILLFRCKMSKGYLKTWNVGRKMRLIHLEGEGEKRSLWW